MYSDYLVNNRFYLKEEISIECAEYSENNGTWSGNHEWIPIKDYIDIFSFVKDGFVFVGQGKHFIYWCDVSLFAKLHCKTKSEVREENIDKILQ
jgi:hypothetical protein